MTVTDTSAKGQNQALSFELELKHPPEKVWRALTQPALMAEWLLPVVNEQLELREGAAFTLQIQNVPGWDGRVECKLLEIEEHRTLRYTWVAGDIVDTVVTFTLTPTAAGTLLSLVQTGFSQKQAFGGARYGWNMMGGRLIDLLERTA